MSDKSAIEWTDATWNPVTGCTKVSAGCAHCYAERFAERWRGTPGHHFEHGFDVQLRPERLDQPIRWRKPRRIFVNSMSDLFHEDVHRDFILRVLLVMARCPQHTFQVLTKRPKRMRDLVSEWLEPAMTLAGGPVLRRPTWPLPNVMLGVSVEDQRAADERIPILLDTPAAVRFLSCEPLLGEVKLRPEWIEKGTRRHFSASVSGALRNRAFVGICDDSGRELHPEQAEHRLRQLMDAGVSRIKAIDCDRFDPESGCLGHPQPVVDWTVVGGESGPKARPCDVAWIRSIVGQCGDAGVPVFVKQIGARPHDTDAMDEVPGSGRLIHGKPTQEDLDTLAALVEAARLCVRDRKGGDPSEWPEDLRVREFPEVAAP